MGYFLTTSPETAVPPKSWATPKTHTPASPVKERGRRYYQSETGRWMARDPIAELAFRVSKNPELFPAVGARMARLVTQIAQRQYSRNLYLFVDNEPLSQYDKLGLLTQTPKWKTCKPPLVWDQRGGGNVPPADGCTFPGWARLLARAAGLMPWSGNKDDPTGKCSFLSACNIHDGCYSRCDQSHEDCDNQLWNNLNTACNFCAQSMPAGRDRDDFEDRCNQWADLFEWAVRTFGDSAYRNRQELNCDYQCPMPPGTEP